MLRHISLLLFFLTLSRAMKGGIVGGREAKPHSRPYMVSVQQDGSHKCGGFLVREDFVLTAAHCLVLSGAGRNYLEVVLGAHNLRKNEKSQQRIQVSKYYRHPNYKKYTDEGDWKNLTVDIMLLKLKNKAKLNKFVGVMALPQKKDTTSALEVCTIAGWGMRKPDDTVSSDVLYETKLTVLPTCECRKKWQIYFDPDSMMCTATAKNNAFCKGDSGGPLMCNSKPQGLAIYVSSKSCNNPDFPEVYLNISTLLVWIKKVMGKKI